MHLKWMQALTLVGCLAGSAFSQMARAQLVNGVLEIGSYIFDGQGADSLGPGSTVITGWTTFNAELAVINQPNNFGIPAQSGAKSLDLTGYHDSSPYGGIQQTVNTLAGQNYTLSFYVGSGGGTTTVTVDTGAGPTSFSNTGASFWQQFTENFTASGPTVLTFTGTTASGNYIGLDDITLDGRFGTDATPEPGSLALFGGLGASALGVLVRRRRSAQGRGN
jgi:hypothetical protein